MSDINPNPSSQNHAVPSGAQPRQPDQPAQPDRSAQSDSFEGKYGAMASDYPGWNPYKYGAPDTGRSNDGDSSKGSASRRTASLSSDDAARGASSPYGADSRQGMVGQPGQSGQNAPGNNSLWTPMGNINLDDPHQNPWYGRWDSYAVISFVLSLFIPILGLVFGVVSMRRTRMFHMKGRGLAIAAVVISVASMLAMAYLVATGKYTEILSSVYGTAGTPAPSDSTGSTAATATSTATPA
ncbi:hypothetical protein PSRA_0385 [Pseudoscardovia radai]|uniref:DUF4190 domain-containing protein n=1 Tax=Pseudoscardovia radai TaxID=987066 RepID=A0A261F0R3_9BIFI|nr:DUF4190 domain-containing protein [Pseudoscardovia radai]OZG52653.1 hypothetical protein PSRA_0385 [Pseudoscardovia radai]